MTLLRESPLLWFKIRRSNILSVPSPKVISLLSKRKSRKWEVERNSVKTIHCFLSLLQYNTFWLVHGRYQIKIPQAGRSEAYSDVNGTVRVDVGGCYVMAIARSIDGSVDGKVCCSLFFLTRTFFSAP